MNQVNEISKIALIRRFINWKSLKLKIKDGLTRFPTQQLMLETYLINPDGSIAKHTKQKAHSYVIGWLQTQELFIANTYNSTGTLHGVLIKNTAGTVKTMLSNYILTVSSVGGSASPGLCSPAGTTTYGILLGTGSTAVTVNDYAMQTLIANGSSAGQLNYSATAVTGAVAAQTTCALSVTRLVGNATGSTITVNELGMVFSMYDNGSQDYFLIVHDNVTQAIGAGQSYLVIYTMTTSISS